MHTFIHQSNVVPNFYSHVKKILAHMQKLKHLHATAIIILLGERELKEKDPGA